MEPLIKIESSNWNDVLEMFKENWPKHVVPYTFVDTLLKYPEMKKVLQFEVYCPYGKISNGVIALSSKEIFQELRIHPLDDLSSIENCLRTTKLIKWDTPIMVAAMDRDTLNLLKKLSDDLNIMVHCDEDVNKYFLDKRTPKFEGLSYPPNTYVGPLVPNHLELIDKTWSYTGEHSRELFEVLMKNHLIYVLYSLDHEPLAWVTYDSVLTHLYSSPDHRQKGYAEFITKYAVNKLLESDHHILAHTLDENQKPQKLFLKLGFQNLGYVYWVSIRPK